MNNKIDYDNLQYVAVNSGKTYDFSTLKDPMSLLEEIKKGTITLQEAKNTEQDYLSSVKWTVLGKPGPKLNKIISSTKPSGPFWATLS